MAFLFANDPELYLKKIDKIELNMEYFILGLAIVGILQTVVTCYLYSSSATAIGKNIVATKEALTAANSHCTGTDVVEPAGTATH